MKALRNRRWFFAFVLLLALGLPAPAEQPLLLPNRQDSVRFAVIGDSGTGGKKQYQVARWMAEYRERFPFEFVLMLGDNLYGGESQQDYERKFELPYKPLLGAGVEFHAVLGNHDQRDEAFYKPFHMDGRRFYTFQKKGMQFFALDSNHMDQEQVKWVEKALAESTAGWKICFFHHPVYSSARRHGSAMKLRAVLEPLFVKYGVNAAFSGHDHVYERVKPQKGVYYFTSGASAKLRKHNLEPSELTAAGFDTDNSFMLVEITGDQLHFQVISRTGETVDSGALPRLSPEKTPSSSP